MPIQLNIIEKVDKWKQWKTFLVFSQVACSTALISCIFCFFSQLNSITKWKNMRKTYKARKIFSNYVWCMVLHQIYCHREWVICHERDNDFSVPGTLISLVHHHLWLDIQYTIWNAMHLTTNKMKLFNVKSWNWRNQRSESLTVRQSRRKWKVICCIYVIFYQNE